MSWSIERRHDHVAVVTMDTNQVKAQNPAFFADLHAAFDRLDKEFSACAVVLTGIGAVFTAGLDFDHHFPLFARRSLKEITAWFDAYRATNVEALDERGSEKHKVSIKRSAHARVATSRDAAT